MNEMTPGASIASQLRQLVIALPYDWELVGRAADYIEELETELARFKEWHIVKAGRYDGGEMHIYRPEDMEHNSSAWDWFDPSNYPHETFVCYVKGANGES